MRRLFKSVSQLCPDRGESYIMTLSPEEVSSLLRDIRESLGLTRGVHPIIEEVYEHGDGSLHAVVGDRAEKSQCLGPGGRVAAELAGRIERRITFYGRAELATRDTRLRLTLRRAEELEPVVNESQRAVLRLLQRAVGAEILYPRVETTPMETESWSTNVRTGLAFSGGTDSCASALILRRLGVPTTLLTMILGEEFLNQDDLNAIQTLAETLDLPHTFVHGSAEAHQEIAERAKAGLAHPCGQCHEAMYESLKQHAVQHGYDVLFTGELLPTGRQAIVMNGPLMVIHLPAALAMSKFRTKTECAMAGISPPSGLLGCRLIDSILNTTWKMLGPTLFRVLRELEAGVLTTGAALAQLKEILKRAQGEVGSG
ncbi:MAG: hypothetical protein ACTSVT_08815 [Candidatus Thorarchaeota archaeon]